MTFAFASNNRLHRFSSLSGTATTFRTVLNADDAIDADFSSESEYTVEKRCGNGDMVGYFSGVKFYEIKGYLV